VVSGPERLLLRHSGSRLCDDSFAGNHSDSAAHSLSHTAAHAAGHATGDSGPDPAHSSAWTSGPIQLRRRGVHVLGLCQADLVLRSPPHLWSADRATAPSRPIQLSGWIRELAGRLVCGQEGVVLQGPWERLPKPGRRMRDFLGAIRLRCRLRQLDGRLVSAQEGLVLCKQGQRVSTGSRRLCMMV